MSDPKDIITELRSWGNIGVDCVVNRAADEIERLRAERDEARRECRLLLLGQEVLRGVRDLPAPPDDLVTIVPVPRKEDKPCQ